MPQRQSGRSVRALHEPAFCMRATFRAWFLFVPQKSFPPPKEAPERFFEKAWAKTLSNNGFSLKSRLCSYHFMA